MPVYINRYHISNRLDILREIKRINKLIIKESKKPDIWGSSYKTIRILRKNKAELQKELEQLIA